MRVAGKDDWAGIEQLREMPTIDDLLKFKAPPMWENPCENCKAVILDVTKEEAEKRFGRGLTVPMVTWGMPPKIFQKK